MQNGGDSLEAQAETIAEWASANGHELVGLESETISGAIELDGREGLARAVSMIREDAADALVVVRLDRLSRKLHIQEATLAIVWREGGSVYEVHGGLVPEDAGDDPYRTFVRQVIGAASELERSLVISRVQAGRRRRAAAGYFIGGKRPYGYRIDGDGMLVPDVEEQKTLRKMRRMRAEGGSIRTVAAAVGLYPETARRILSRS